jgi:hypothetical protein
MEIELTIIKKDLQKLRRKLKEYSICHKSYNEKTLECMCGISSLSTFRYLKKLKLRPVFHMNDVHCFVTCRINKKKHYIDLTLKQFHRKFPAVYFESFPAKPIPHWVEHDVPHYSKKSSNTEKKIKRMFVGWDKWQNPFKVNQIPEI